MVRLDDMRLFAQFATARSLTEAARALGLPKQTLSRRLGELERALGVELARRTTRSLSLTDVGRAYAARCVEVARLADEANFAASSQLEVVGGVLRVTADHAFGDAFLPELVAAYVQAHPSVRVDITLTSRKVDLLEEGFDVAFRIGAPPDVTHLAATRLGPAQLWTVAAPSYLRSAPLPGEPADLNQHACVTLSPAPRRDGWPFAFDGVLRMVGVPSRVRVNGLAIARRAALGGVGIAHLPKFAVQHDVATGALARVLEPYAPDVGGVHVVYPHSRLLAPKVTEFVALAVDRFGDALSESTGRP